MSSSSRTGTGVRTSRAGRSRRKGLHATGRSLPPRGRTGPCVRYVLPAERPGGRPRGRRRFEQQSRRRETAMRRSTASAGPGAPISVFGTGRPPRPPESGDALGAAAHRGAGRGRRRGARHPRKDLAALPGGAAGAGPGSGTAGCGAGPSRDDRSTAATGDPRPPCPRSGSEGAGSAQAGGARPVIARPAGPPVPGGGAGGPARAPRHRLRARRSGCGCRPAARGAAGGAHRRAGRPSPPNRPLRARTRPARAGR